MSGLGWIVLAVVALFALAAVIFLRLARRAPIWTQNEETRHDD